MGKSNKEMEQEYLAAISDAIEELSNCVTGSKERQTEAQIVKDLTHALAEIKAQEEDEKDKAERRRIEEEKNEKNAVIEKLKAEKSWTDRIWDLGTKIGCGLVSIMGSVYMLSLILEFEEKGSLRSKPGREFRIFNPTQWFK